MAEKVTIGNCELYLADSREVLPSLVADALICDPPYGVGLGSRKNNNRERESYTMFDDTAEYVEAVAVPIVAMALERVKRGAVTPGVRCMFSYPKAQHVGAIYYPAATGCNSWGFSCWQPVLYYGKDPYGGQGSMHDSFSSTEAAEKNGHPCPKPLRQMQWLINRASKAGETVLDPFMGSGTTGVAAVSMGRRFIGIEIEPQYFDIACRRIEQAYAQPRLFEDAKVGAGDTAVQVDLLPANAEVTGFRRNRSNDE